MAELAAARAVLARVGLDPTGLVSIGEGLSSDAWRITDRGRSSVLRIPSDPADTETDTTYRMEHALMAVLATAGAAVPTPVIGSWELDDWSGRPFSITTFVDGDPLRPEDHARAVRPIADFLRILHGLPITGYGPLVVTDTGSRGGWSTMTDGLLAWAQYPLWPIGGAGLEVHPALGDDASTVARLEIHADSIRTALAVEPGVLLHTDLHEENILDADGRCSFIDLGEAFVGPSAWDLAALAYFLGWSSADPIIDAYATGGGDVARRRRDATEIALCFGVHRWRQDRELGFDDDAHDRGFLEETLGRADDRSAGGE